MMKLQQPFHSPEIYIVEASAGSGKTYALAKRYVRLILFFSFEKLKNLSSQKSFSLDSIDFIPIHNILAITFTNKAAFEMKERILTFLKELAFQLMPQEQAQDMLANLGMSYDEASTTAHHVIHAILRKYYYFQVQTIDKFIHTLMMGSAFQIGLTANFKIQTSSKNHLRVALDRLIDQAQKDKKIEKLFDDFLFSLLNVEARFAWIPKKIILDTLIELFAEYNLHAIPFAPPQNVLKKILQCKQDVLSQAHDFMHSMPEGVDQRFSTAIQKFVADHEKSFSFKDLSQYFHIGKDIKMKKNFSASLSQENQWREIQQGLQNIAQLETRHLYDSYIFLFQHTMGFLQEMKKKEDIVFLEELNAMVNHMHTQGMSLEELYYRLATRFHHFLFDEFQDTSTLQWDNLKTLPEDAIAQGGSLFYVGDKKQAIYTFRGGNTELFDQIQQQYQDNHYPVVKEVLDVSRRSCCQIVEFNNHIFHMDHLRSLMNIQIENSKGKEEKLIPAREKDYQELERVYRTSHQKVHRQEPQGYVEVTRIPSLVKEKSDQEIKKELLKRVHSLKERFSLKDIGILVRKNQEIEKVTQWLLADGISCFSERTMNLKQNSLIQEIISFLRFLISPIDNRSFGEFLLGRVFSQISQLSQETIQEFLLNWPQSKEKFLYIHFRQQFPQIWQDSFEEYFSNVGVFSVYELIVSFYQQTRLLHLFPGETGFLMKFLHLIKKHENEFSHLESFLFFYEDCSGDALFVDIVGTDGVQVMTIHKAKGLEFGVVIAPFLTMSLLKPSGAARRALKHTLQVTDDGLVCYHVNSQYAPYSEEAENLETDEKMKLFFSELNNVYVAFTRAIYELYIFLPWKAGNSDNLAKYLIPETFSSQGEQTQRIPTQQQNSKIKTHHLKPHSCRHWISFLQDEFSFYSQGQESGLKKGILYHQVLSVISNVQEKYDEVISQTLSLFQEQMQKTDMEFLKKFFSDEKVKQLFSLSGEVHTEFEMVDSFGRIFRLDRLVVTKEDVYVIDFKLSRATESQAQEQVQQYMKQIQSLYPKKNIKGCLVFLKEIEIIYV